MKKCLSCGQELNLSDKFCTKCGTKIDDDYIKSSAKGNSGYVYRNPVVTNSNSSKESLFGILLQSTDYSVDRAWWLYRKAESITNVINKIILVFGLIYAAIYLIITTHAAVWLGLMQLVQYLLLALLFFIYLVFTKLAFVTVGSLIRIAEISEKNSTQ